MQWNNLTNFYGDCIIIRKTFHRLIWTASVWKKNREIKLQCDIKFTKKLIDSFESQVVVPSEFNGDSIWQSFWRTSRRCLKNLSNLKKKLNDELTNFSWTPKNRIINFDHISTGKSKYFERHEVDIYDIQNTVFKWSEFWGGVEKSFEPFFLKFDRLICQTCPNFKFRCVIFSFFRVHINVSRTLKYTTTHWHSKLKVYDVEMEKLGALSKVL